MHHTEVNIIVLFSALVTAFEKAKKKYQAKVKKLEAQMQAIKERYETQVRNSILNRLKMFKTTLTLSRLYLIITPIP